MIENFQLALTKKDLQYLEMTWHFLQEAYVLAKFKYG